MTTNEKPIILIDGSSYLYRAFFACPPLTNPHGEPTGAIMGVINMIKSLINQYQPDRIAVVFDAKGGSFRNEIYAEYKATRESMPEDLRPQVQPIHDILTAMGLPLLCVEGVEADDVIGTLARQAEEAGHSVLISTGDKDMAQLVTDKITLINTMNNSVLDPDGVVNKFGVPPEKIIDFLALMGDKSDNIPGVPGVGEKTAMALLSHFDSIVDIYARIDEIDSLGIRGAKSIKQKLIDNKALAEISYRLATIKTDVVLDISNDQLIPHTLNNNELITLLQYHGFQRWVNEVKSDKFLNRDTEQKSDIATISTTSSSHTKSTDKMIDPSNEIQSVTTRFIPNQQDYQTILTLEQLEEWVKMLSESEIFAFDTETNSLEHVSAKLVGISICVHPYKAAYIPLNHHYLGVPKQLDCELVVQKLKPILENKNIHKICQNIKFDYSIMLNYGVDMQGICFDTMLESYVINSNHRHDMDSLSVKHLNYQPISYDELTKQNKKRIGIDEVEIESVTNYAAEDADVTYQLHQKLYKELAENQVLKTLFENIEMPLAFILAKIERTGVLIDEFLLSQLSQTLSIQLEKIEETIFTLAGEKFNPASPKQLQVILFEKHNLPILKKTPKGDPSTSEEVLSELAEQYELPQMILDYRSLAKLKNTYTDKLPLMINQKDGRIHTNYNQVGTVTGRLSSNDPNLQNIPVRTEEGRRIRQAFVAPEGYKIISADYSQIELRIMAHLSQDKGLLDAFRDGKDIHRVTAAEILSKPEVEITSEERRSAKAVNFGLIYGMSAFGLAKQINSTRQQATFYMNRYFERYPGVQRYMDEIRESASQNGYVETLSGRRLYLPRISSNNAIERKAAERAAINAPMQGTAADIIKTAMIAVDKWINTQPEGDIRMIMQVHDELVFEVKAELADTLVDNIKEIMENCYTLSIPLKVDAGIGDNWDEAH